MRQPSPFDDLRQILDQLGLTGRKQDEVVVSVRDVQLELDQTCKFMQQVGGAPVEMIGRLIEERKLEVLLIGDSEWPCSAYRRDLAEILQFLRGEGFTGLAIEWPDTDQNILNQLRETGNTAPLSELFVQRSDRLKDSSRGKNAYAADPFYVQMISEACRNGMEIRFIDETAQNDGTYRYRDQSMCNAIRDLKRTAPKIVVIGGAAHHYTRTTSRRGKRLSLSEQLKTHLDEQRIASVLCISGRDYQTSYHKFASVVPELAEPLCFNAQSHPVLAVACACVEARCEYGSCQRVRLKDGRYDDCAYCKRIKPQASREGMQPVMFSNWDLVAIYPERDPVLSII